MIKELLRLANHLDAKGLTKEADYLDDIINKVAANPPDSNPSLMVKYYEVMQGKGEDGADTFHGLYAAKVDDKHYFYLEGKGWVDPCDGKRTIACSELEFAKENGKLNELDGKPTELPQFEMPVQEDHNDPMPQAKEEPQAEDESVGRKKLDLRNLFKRK